MFDGIARRYDTLNHVLSGGLDLVWRRRAIRALALAPGARLLDMCTGTGDLALAAVGGAVPGVDVVGVDFSGEMLRHGLVKVRAAGLGGRIRLVRGDATRVPLPDGSVDAAAVAFGIRNVVDRDRACREFCRVLKPGGRLAVLEFGNPTLPGWKQLYGWYSRVVLPKVGAMISGDSVAYSYLPASISQFPEPDQFAEDLRRSGFSTVEWKAMTFGTVYLHIATK
ncbi:MAG: bifunctional demethylmenaquinone methyltransferase/2-methoxy-6-polyprenyl-1,4-benzoquinol methylase UbiE [Acidobacteria bacterium]|nr:MAG: bifunctional demethylmenaquinone methyltransferase/2-methoxy-6-polyprenyl-1,4-benzoquinol methylase UbiE [Acidobacteriota bacterium]